MRCMKGILTILTVTMLTTPAVAVTCGNLGVITGPYTFSILGGGLTLLNANKGTTSPYQFTMQSVWTFTPTKPANGFTLPGHPLVHATSSGVVTRTLTFNGSAKIIGAAEAGGTGTYILRSDCTGTVAFPNSPLNPSVPNEAAILETYNITFTHLGNSIYFINTYSLDQADWQDQDVIAIYVAGRMEKQ